MEILQLPIQALEERIEQELIENPVLEVRDEDPALPKERTEQENPDAPTVDEKPLVVDEQHNNAEDFERLEQFGEECPDYFDERPRVSSNRIEEEAERQHDLLANLAANQESLQDYLLRQLGELDLDPRVRELAEQIISTLEPEDGGRFRRSLKDLLPPNATDEDLRLAEEALRVVQQLDPPGIAARDLRECLLLQLTPDMPYYEEVKTLVTNHLEDLRDNRLPQIQKATGYSLERIQAALEQLRKLNPKPGADFEKKYVPAVRPDVIVEQTDDGRYVVRLVETGLPRLYISPYYRRRLQSGEATPEEREFIKKKLNAAQWLIDAIQQRRNTLTKVAQAIVDHQRRFLDDGPEFIEPLKMQQIADKVGVHVTTVSRAVDDKWIETPRGIFPLRRFFVGGTRTADGEDVAWDAIRIKLQELIDHEDKSHPYSDDELVKLLREQGLNVARRTITKYRQKMGIPSSRQRRDWTKVHKNSRGK